MHSLAPFFGSLFDYIVTRQIEPIRPTVLWLYKENSDWCTVDGSFPADCGWDLRECILFPGEQNTWMLADMMRHSHLEVCRASLIIDIV